jgi:hypothetical protein
MSGLELLEFLNYLLVNSRTTIKETKTILQRTATRMLDILTALRCAVSSEAQMTANPLLRHAVGGGRHRQLGGASTVRWSRQANGRREAYTSPHAVSQ